MKNALVKLLEIVTCSFFLCGVIYLVGIIGLHIEFVMFMFLFLAVYIFQEDKEKKPRKVRK